MTEAHAPVEEVAQVGGQRLRHRHRKLLDLAALSERQQQQPQTPDVALLPGAGGQRVLAEAHVALLEDVLPAHVGQPLGQAVVGEPHVAPSVQQHAGREQLLVHHGAAVQIVQRRHQLHAVTPQTLHGHRGAARQSLGQTGARHVLGQQVHHQTVVALAAGQRLVLHQVRVLQLQQRVELALRALDLTDRGMRLIYRIRLNYMTVD